MRNIFLFFLVLFCNACAFKGLDNKCSVGGEGNSCTPVTENINYAVNKSQVYDMSHEDMDKEVFVSEYSRVATKNQIPSKLNSREVRIYVYPYSDGDRFYDSRNIYIVIKKDGWSKGTYVYTDKLNFKIPSSELDRPEKVVIDATNLNVRSYASDKSKVVGVLPKGTIVYPQDRIKDWYYISSEHDGIEVSGWIYSKYTKLSD